MTSSIDEPERQPDQDEDAEVAHETGDAVPGEPGWTARDDEKAMPNLAT